MSHDTPPTTAVLTGDLVGSTQAGSAIVDRAMETLEQSAQEIAGWFPGSDTRFTRYRGDGWQIIVTPPHICLRAALFLTAKLKAARVPLTTRISIGIGTVDYPGKGRLLSDASGSAFESSGRGLDSMLRGRELALDGQGIGQLDKSLTLLLAIIARRWTAEQAEALAYDLEPSHQWTQSEISLQFGISAQAVNYRLNGANALDLRLALAGWEGDFQVRETQRQNK